MEKSEIVLKTICHASVLQGVPLPATFDRDEGHQVVGLAAQVGLSRPRRARRRRLLTARVLSTQAFHVPATMIPAGQGAPCQMLLPGFISGFVSCLRADAESVGNCTQVFYVSNCQPKAFEVAIAIPSDDQITFNQDTAQR